MQSIVRPALHAVPNVDEYYRVWAFDGFEKAFARLVFNLEAPSAVLEKKCNGAKVAVFCDACLVFTLEFCDWGLWIVEKAEFVLPA